MQSAQRSTRCAAQLATSRTEATMIVSCGGKHRVMWGGIGLQRSETRTLAAGVPCVGSIRRTRSADAYWARKTARFGEAAAPAGSGAGDDGDTGNR